MMKKEMMVMATAAMTAAMTITAFAGWDQDEKGYWYLNDSGSYARDQIMNIDGVNYAFDQQAYMVKGWYQQNGNWYYFSTESGGQMTGWQQIDGKWYYLNPDNGGIMQTGWLNHSGKRYHMDESGVMNVGAFVADGFYYFAETDGSLRRNTIDKENGITIRYDEEGREWYKNEESLVNSQNGGESWLPLLEDTALMQQRSEIQESNAEFIEETKDDLYEKYKAEISTAKNSTSRQRKIEKWKDKATRQLSKLAVPQEEIDAYINEVIQACYEEDNSSADDYDDYDYEDDWDDYDWDDYDWDDYDWDDEE